ncbi:MAG: alpha/beta hydrolase [SAR324 cluster bacterium]|nr:alpha/beta hydrolase [SAR324 cluster bacterium]
MKEEVVSFSAGDVTLEGLLQKGSGDLGVVVTHPHPLYGGDMYNAVVGTIVRSFQKKGYTTLRFNFRGVGKSEGNFDDGQGEQRDVLSALEYLKASGCDSIVLTGYSFGVWVNAQAAGKSDLYDSMVMVAPPVAFIDFQPVAAIPRLDLVIGGSRDDFAPPVLIEQMLSSWNPNAHFEVLDRADHFFVGYNDRLEAAILSNLM